MKYIKLYENFDGIIKICKNNNFKSFVINTNGTVDVNSDVDLSNKNLIKLPVKFNTINGSFYCNNNKFETLEDFPKKIDGDFDCSSNKLMVLYGFPEYFNGQLTIKNNPICEILDLVDDKLKFIEWLNKYDVIRYNGSESVVIGIRLKEAYLIATKKELNISKLIFRNYTLIR